ncbi:MAG: FtsX-like permease family protein [Lachnospiraceae bacterium]
MAMLASNIMTSDSSERDSLKQAEQYKMGFSWKLSDISTEELDYMEHHEEVVHVDAIEKVELVAGLDNVDCLVSSGVPDTWKMEYLYGKAPGEGEILLTENARISSRQPVPGETARIEVRAGRETKQMDVTVAGVIKGLDDFTGAYGFLYHEDFITLTEGIAKEERKYDAFVQTIYGYAMNGTLWGDMYERFGTNNIIGISENLVNKEYSVGGVVLPMVLTIVIFGGCLAAIIYIVLQDEKKNIGIFRALGARKTQIATMLTIRIFVSGVLGILLGSGLTVLVQKIENMLTYTDTGAVENIGAVSMVMIPFGGLVALLVLQLPALYALLREAPIALMNELRHAGENLISLKGTKVFHIKHPIWWYAGLEGKRLKGRRIGLALITVFGLLFPSMTFMNLQGNLKSDEKKAVDMTYTVKKENGYFTEEEVQRILKLPGVQSAGFSVEQYGECVAEYAGEACMVRLQILDEKSFRKMKKDLEAMGISVAEESGEELLGESGIVVRGTRKTLHKKVPEAATVQLLSSTGERYECEVVLNARNYGELDADYYMFIGFGTYCEVYGVPELQEFSVTLKNTAYAKTVDRLRQTVDGVSLMQNELLLGNTLRELHSDTIVSTIAEVFLSILASAVFLFCYYSFYYLAKTEEYRKLFAMGASMRMVKNTMLLQSLRSSWFFSLLNAGFSYLVYRYNVSSISDVWLQENTTKLPLAALILLMLFVVGISMSATWFASGQVLKELEQKA